MRLLTIFAVSASVLGLAACQPADTTEADATETAAADEGMADDEMAIDSPDAGVMGDPDAFVRNIYTGMAAGEMAVLSEDSETLWSRAAWADIERYWAVAPEGFNVDPLCNCQDPAGLTIRDLTITETGPDSADAAITTLQGDAQVSQVLKLVREEGSWRIDNITREGDPAFRDELAQWTAEAQG